MNLDPKIESRIRKVMALADRGVGGEQENATRQLQAMLKKHNVSIDDFIDEAQRKDEVFEFSGGRFYRKLMLQIIVSVCGAETDLYKSSARRNVYIVSVTGLEKMEIELRYSLYSKSLADQFELMFSAFIHKHNLFAPDAGPPPEMTAESLTRAEKISGVMQNLDDVHIHEAIAPK